MDFFYIYNPDNKTQDHTYNNKVWAGAILLLLAWALFPAFASARASHGQANKSVQDLKDGDYRQRSPHDGNGVGDEAGKGGVEQGAEKHGEDMASGL